MRESTTCKMASSTQSGSVVVTPMYPQESGPTAPAFGTTPHVSSALGKFLKGDPKARGIVQIMIGVLHMLFGIAIARYAESIAVFTGIVFWGGFIYISSGALCVAANNKLNKCLVRGALGMNIISTITAGISIICFSLDIGLRLHYYCPYSDYDDRCMLQAISKGMIVLLLVFSIPEFIISICVSAFACRAVCDCSTEQVVYMPPTSNQVASENLLIPAPNTCQQVVYMPPTSNQMASENLLIPAPNTCQTTVNYTHYPTVMGSMQTARPPQYEVRP